MEFVTVKAMTHAAIITQNTYIDVQQLLENIWICITEHSFSHCKFSHINFRSADIRPYHWLTIYFRAGGLCLTFGYFFHHKKSKNEDKSKTSTYWLSAIGIYCIVAAVGLFIFLDPDIFFSIFDSGQESWIHLCEPFFLDNKFFQIKMDS